MGPETTLLAVLVLAGVDATSVPAPAATEHWRADELLHLGWGAGELQVGVREAPGFLIGPQALSVDEEQGRLHVLDSVNERVLTFSLAGAPIGSVAVPPLAEDVQALSGDRLAVLVPAMSSIECVGLDGDVCGRLDLGPDVTAARGLRRLAEGEIALWRPDNTVIPVAGHGFPDGPHPDAFAATVSAPARPVESSVRVRRSPDGTATVTAEAGGKVAVDLPRRCGAIESVTPLGSDDGGRQFLAVEERCTGAISRFLEVAVPTGGAVAVAELPTASEAFVYRDLEVTRGGAVYQMIVQPDGVRVLRWSAASGNVAATAHRTAVPGWPQAARIAADAGGVAPAGAAAASTAVSVYEVMSRALAYASHSYAVGAANVTPAAGVFCGGKLVKTPEWLSSAGTMTGLPYKWGGFTALEGWSPSSNDGDCAGTNTAYFAAGLAEGQLAGDTCASSCSGMYCGTHCAVGVDCSGYVSRAWGLSGHVTTSALPTSPYTCRSPLPSYDDLIAGDVLDRAGSHMRLFAGRSPSGSIEVLESSGRDWKVAAHSYLVAELAGYVPYRKRALGGVFEVGEPVRSIDDGVEVRACTDTLSPSCVLLGTVSRGRAGTIVGGPDERGGYLWWSVDWGSGLAGWTVQCSLGKSGAPPTLGASLGAAPESGEAPLSATLLASVAGSATGPVSYTVWWDCDDETADPAGAATRCGVIPTAPAGTCTTPSAVGVQCNGVWDNPKGVEHTYSESGEHVAKVIVERDGATAESHTTISVLEPCSFALSPESVSVAWDSATGGFDVTAAAWCSWQAVSGEAWIHVVSGSGTGDGAVSFTVDANPTTSARCGTIVAGDEIFRVTQMAVRAPRTQLPVSRPQ